MTLNGEHSFTDKKRLRLEAFSDMLFDMSYEKISDLECTAYISEEPLKFSERFSGRKQKIKANDKWADNVFDCAWFHLTGKMPSDGDSRKTVLLVNCGGEGLVFDKNGNVIQGITSFASEGDSRLGPPMKRVIPLCDSIVDGDDIDIWVDCGANDLFGVMRRESRADEMDVAKENSEIRGLAFDVQVLLNVVDFGDDKEFGDEITKELEKHICVEMTEEKAAEIRKALKYLLDEKNTTDDFTYYSIGHAHLDLAWLWPIRESKRKGGRTFSSQIRNIERYPDYVFGASQAQLYQWVKDEYPDVYAKVKQLVKTPNWDVQGATWVEPDSNLISGESLVRQFFYGKKFYKDEFGLDMQIFWVPDSFGYSACIPQVMKLSGVKYFLTQKMSWNTVNKFPYHSFNWTGLDGSTVLAHMLPENTYNAPMRADYMTNGEKRYAERKISNKALALFGIGDGGAGPGYEHIERARRYSDLRSMPKVKMTKSMDFFNDFDDGVTPYPSYSGELYLEKHQGTYTTRAYNKRFNRKCEFALKNYEAVKIAAEKQGITSPVSHSEIETIWKEILLYQFHDILPGSSINRVYDECLKRYDIIYNKITNATAYLLNEMHSSKTAVNMNSFAYDTKIKLGKHWYGVKVPAMGSYSVGNSDKLSEFSAKATYNSIENDKVKVTFENGFVSSMFDKTTNREYIRNGSHAAVVSQYDDMGDCWDMTDSRADYIQTKKDCKCTGFKSHTDGAKAYAKCKYKVGNCEIAQYFYIIDGDGTLYCDLDIDCNQEASMLRIAFPVNIETEECAFNVQYGHLKRRTTENNSVELAQFEVSGQKFVDMSDGKNGIALINDCKYGYRCKNGVVDMNLVRTPDGGPGEHVDQGHHTIHYALMAHSGGVTNEVYKKAYYLNNPLFVTDGEIAESESKSVYSCDNDNIILESVKEPEDGNGIIVRFYNCSENEQSARISVAGYTPSEIVNIPEDKIADTNGSITLHKFELINIRFVK